MGDAIRKYDFILNGCLRVCFYRSLHMLSVPFNVHEVEAYARENANGEGVYGGNVSETRHGPLISWFDWQNIRVGEGITMDMRFFGLHHGAQTIFLKRQWFLGNFRPYEVTNALAARVLR